MDSAAWHLRSLGTQGPLVSTQNVECAKWAWLAQTLPPGPCPQPEQSLPVFVKHLALQTSAPQIPHLLLVTLCDAPCSTCPPETLSHLQHPPPRKPTSRRARPSVPWATPALGTHWQCWGASLPQHGQWQGWDPAWHSCLSAQPSSEGQGELREMKDASNAHPSAECSTDPGMKRNGF